MTLRILHVAATYAPVVGGTETFSAKISEALVRAGHDVRVETSNVPDPLAYYCLQRPLRAPAEEIVRGVPVRRFAFIRKRHSLLAWAARLLPERAARRLSWFALQRARRRWTLDLAERIREFSPDAVMAAPHLVANVECVLEARKLIPFPLFLAPFLHESDPGWPRARMREALASSAGVLALTRSEARVLERDYGVPSERLFVLGEGVELPGRCEPADRTPKRVLSLGRIALSKNLVLAARAMREVRRLHPDAEWIVAGSETPETRGVTARIREALGDQKDCVRFLTNLDEQTKERLWGDCRCLLFPSQIESFGLVVLEAFAHARPVVAADIPPLRELVGNGERGFLARADDPADFAAGVSRLLADPREAARLGGQARQAAAQYTWDRSARECLRAYESAAAAPGRRTTP